MSDRVEEPCIACSAVLQQGDLVLFELDGGYIHAKCCGPERESYYGPDGGPIGPNDPLPTPFRWTQP